MYDGTDVALVLGGLFSAALAGISLISAVISQMFFVTRKSKGETASFSGRLAFYFAVTAVLCGMSIASGWAIYDIFEHQRGHPNPPAHVIAVTIAVAWGPVAASVFGIYWLRRRKKAPGTE